MLSLDDVQEILSLDLIGVIPESTSVLNASNSGVPVILQTPHGAGREILEGLQAGAYHYLTKPINFDEVAHTIERALDRAGLERLIRYCARGPLAFDRLHLVRGRSDQILYLLPKPDPAGRTALRLSALEFLDRLANILPPPRIHRHRYHGVFAPNAPLRPLVTEQARQLYPDSGVLDQLGPEGADDILLHRRVFRIVDADVLRAQQRASVVGRDLQAVELLRDGGRHLIVADYVAQHLEVVQDVYLAQRQIARRKRQFFAESTFELFH